MSLACGLLIPFLMFTRQEHSLPKMTAIWLLPVVAAEVAAASGALLAAHLPASEAFAIVVVSYGLWGFSVPLAMSLLVILLLRLALHNFPSATWPPPAGWRWGRSARARSGCCAARRRAPRAFAAAGLSGAASVAFGCGLLGGAALWGYGFWWLMLALLKTTFYLRGGMPFNMGWWGFTFPLAVYTLATLALANATHLPFLSAIGALLVAVPCGFLAIVAARTALGAWSGALFVSPCLQQAPRRGFDAGAGI